jgi:aspartate aminotransferase-like enzyme
MHAGEKLAKYTLFTPGPVDVSEAVLRASAQPLVYHRDEQFSELLARTTELLNTLIEGNNKIFYLTSSGTGAMEAICCNILSQKDTPIVAVCGKFGERWLELCTAYNIKPVVIREALGKSIKPENVEAALKKLHRPTVIFTTLAETSTGALDDIKAFGELSVKYDAVLVVDGIAGVGADRCPQRAWHVDVLIGASQKALMAPPGIAFISVSERVKERMKKADLPKYYFNLQTYDKFREKHQTPFTPAITILYAFKKGLETIATRGVEKNYEHHRKMAEYVRKRIIAMGLRLFPDVPSNALTVIKMPEGIDSTSIIQTVKEKYHILFANGQVNLRGKIIRIGHMGNYTVPKLGRALDALEKALKQRR